MSNIEYTPLSLSLALVSLSLDRERERGFILGWWSAATYRLLIFGPKRGKPGGASWLGVEANKGEKEFEIQIKSNRNYLLFLPIYDIHRSFMSCPSLNKSIN
jgi:hypothetical protein